MKIVLNSLDFILFLQKKKYIIGSRSKDTAALS